MNGEGFPGLKGPLVSTVFHFLPNQFWILYRHQHPFPAPPRQDEDQCTTYGWSFLNACWIKAGWVRRKAQEQGTGWRAQNKSVVLISAWFPSCRKRAMNSSTITGAWTTFSSTFQPGKILECHSSWITHYSDAGNNIRKILLWCYE